MNLQNRFSRVVSLFAVLFMLVFATQAAAHCDSMDGPVIADAQKALIEKDVTPVLKWVPAGDEAEIRRTFEMALAVRGESDTASTVADNYFFETLVRIHRESEGAPFTGLKPLGSMEPEIAAADRALETGNLGGLDASLLAAIKAQIEERFAHALATRKLAAESPEKGREYVTAYVEFTHFIEALAHLNKEGISHGH